ncbi:MAG: hypothetical protein PSV46_14845 [Reyranella sp.]|nr:hypothetical protein [Reyranella sp.]
MSASPACDGSTIETIFVVGPDLVEFDRHDLPIYATPESRPESRWADAGLDTCTYGAPLDRLFGEPGDVFVTGVSSLEQQAAAGAAVLSSGEDPLVALGTLSDGLILPTLETSGDHPAPEVATIFDAGIDSFAAVHLAVDGTWNADTWSFDYGT